MSAFFSVVFFLCLYFVHSISKIIMTSLWSVFVSMLLVDLLSLIKSLCCLFVAIKSIWFLIGLRLGFPSGPIRDALKGAVQVVTCESLCLNRVLHIKKLFVFRHSASAIPFSFIFPFPNFHITSGYSLHPDPTFALKSPRIVT